MGVENTPRCYTSQKSQVLIGLSKGRHNLKATHLISIFNYMGLLHKIYCHGMLHLTWTTSEFSRNQLGMVSAYVMLPCLIAFLMCTFKWLYSIKNQCHKEFHLMSKAAINKTEISPLVCKTILILNEHNFQYLLVVRSPSVRFIGE